VFVHIIGFVAWLGGGWRDACGITAKYFPPDQRLAVYRVMSVVTRNLSPRRGARRGSGFVLSSPSQGRHGPDLASGDARSRAGSRHCRHWDRDATAARLGRLELDPRGELPESFAGLRRARSFSRQWLAFSPCSP